MLNYCTALATLLGRVYLIGFGISPGIPGGISLCRSLCHSLPSLSPADSLQWSSCDQAMQPTANAVF